MAITFSTCTVTTVIGANRALWHSKKSTTISFLPGLPSVLLTLMELYVVYNNIVNLQYHKTLSMIPMMLSQHLPNTTQLNSTQLNSTQHNSTQHNTTQHNTTQLNTTQLNTTQLNTIQHNSTQHNSTQLDSTQHNTTQLNTTQHNTTQHNSTQHNTTQLNTTQHNNQGSHLPPVRYKPTTQCSRQVYSNYSQLR